tara:strand:- start:162 stop:2291 length:2130 start_codon:yes stop_codon:yes gene_type:complete
MARISTYPIDSTPSVEDMVIGTEVDNLDVTKNYRIGDLLALGGNGTVTDIRLGDGDREGTAITISGVFTFLGTGGITTTVSGTTMTIDGSGISAAVTQITAGTNITVNPAGGTGNVTINSTDQYEGTVKNVAYTTNINAFTANVSNSGISPVITLNLNGGSAGQFLQQDGEWATVPGGSSGVTSVGLSAPSAFTVSNSPVTGIGTLTFAGAGLTTDYVDGTGSLQSFPTIPSVPTNIVETVDTTDGGFIALTPVSPASGNVVITADLSAVDGTDTSGLFLSKDNLWSAPPGGSGGVTQITAGTNVTVSPIGGTGNVTINSTDQFIGTVTGVTGTLPITSSGGITPAIGINNYTGADGTTAGTKGAVPAPAATDNVKFLKGDGTWATVPGGGGLVTSLTTTGTSGASTLISGVLNVPNYADNNTEYTLTTTGASGDIATLVGTVINVPTPVIPYTSLTTTGTSGASTLVGGVLNIPNYTAGGVISVDKTTPGTSTGNPIIVNPTTGNVLVQSMAYAGTTNIGHVPTGGDNTKFLRGDGTWVVPSGGGTYTAGIGLTLTGAEFTANVDGTQTVAANASSATALRTYNVQVDSNDDLVVNVPWVNDNDDTGITGVTLATNNTGTWTVPLSESITGRELTITSNVYSGGSKVGYVPPSGSNTTFLRGDGTWVTPTDTVGAVLSVNETTPGTSSGTPIVVRSNYWKCSCKVNGL